MYLVLLRDTEFSSLIIPFEKLELFLYLKALNEPDPFRDLFDFKEDLEDPFKFDAE